MENIVNKNQIEAFIRGKLKQNQPFCTLPWTKVWIEDGTQIRNCCYQVDSVGDLSKQTFQEIWNGEPQREVREFILKGRFHPICKCLEKVGSIPQHPEPEVIQDAKNLKLRDISQSLKLFDNYTNLRSYLIYILKIFFRRMINKL
jgi:hypothetical protein